MQKSIIEETLEKINKGKNIVLSSKIASLSKCTYIYCILRFLVDGRIKVFNALEDPKLPKIQTHKILSLKSMNADEEISYRFEKLANKKVVKIKTVNLTKQVNYPVQTVEIEEIRYFIKKLKYKMDKQAEKNTLNIDIEFLLEFLEKIKLNKISNNLTSVLDSARLEFTLLGEQKQEFTQSFYLNLSPSPESVIMNLTSPVYFTYEYTSEKEIEPSTIEQINNLSGSYKLAQKIKALESINASLTSIIPSEVLGKPQPLTPSLKVASYALLESVSRGVYGLKKSLDYVGQKNPLSYKEDSYDKYEAHIFDCLNLKGLNVNGFIFLSDKGLPMAYSKDGRKDLLCYTIEKMKYKSPGVFNLANSNTIGKIYIKSEEKKLFFTLSFQLKFGPYKFSQFMIDDVIETAHEMRVLQAKGKNPLGNSKNLKYNILSSKNTIKIK